MKKMTNTWLLMAIIILVPALFLDTTLSMVAVWRSNETFTHGFLIFPISLWLIWQNRDQVDKVPIYSRLFPLALVLPVLIVWLLSDVADIKVVQQLALVGLIPLVVWTLLGGQIVRAALFPLAYLVFAVPLGQELIPPMMDFTANFTVELIRLSGIPVFQDGLSFILPSGDWSVVEECSGVRYLIASLALGSIFAYLTYQRLYKRVLFFLFAIAVPVFANGLRAYMIVMIGHFSGMKYAVGADHLLYGWVFFGLVIFLMFSIGSIWRDPAPATDSAPSAPPGQNSRALRLLPLITLAVLFLFSNWASTELTKPPTEGFLPDYVQVPKQIGRWRQLDQIEFDWSPIFNNPDEQFAYLYGKDGKTVRLDIGYFRYQRSGAEAISSMNWLTDPYGGDWKIIAARTVPVADQKVMETEIKKGYQTILVWHWYQVGDNPIYKAPEAKLRQLLIQLLNGRHDASMITIGTATAADITSARARLRQFKTLLDSSVF